MVAKTVSLQPNESREAIFTFTPTEAKIYNVSVDGLSGIIEVVAPVLLPLELSIRLDPVGNIYVGGMVGIYGIIANPNTTQVIYVIAWFINGQKVSSLQPQTINPGNIHEKFYRYTPLTVGHYDVKVAVDGVEASDSFDAIEAPPGVPEILAWRPTVLTPVKAGASLYADSIIENIGTGIAHYTLEWHLINPSGIEVASKTDSGTLAPGTKSNPTYYTHYWTDPVLSIGGVYIVKTVLIWDGHTNEYSNNVSVFLPVPLNPSGREVDVWWFDFDGDGYIGDSEIQWARDYYARERAEGQWSYNISDEVMAYVEYLYASHISKTDWLRQH